MDTGTTTLAFVQDTFVKESVGEFEKNQFHRPPAGFEIAFVSDDIAASFNHAVAVGAHPVQKPIQKPWGQWVAYLLDCNNVIVEICSALQ